jgi:hypothetical protein
VVSVFHVSLSVAAMPFIAFINTDIPDVKEPFSQPGDLLRVCKSEALQFGR